MKRWLGLLLLAAFAGCAGAGGGNTSPVPAPSKPAMGTLTVKIIVPGAASAGSNVKLRRAFAAAETTNGILFTVYPHGGNPSTQAIVSNGNDISSTSTACTTAGTTRTCTVQIAAPVGTANDLLAQTYDQIIPSNGTVPGTAHLLASGVSPSITVTAGSSNTVSLTLNPVLATVQLVSTPNAVHALLPANNISISVLGFDAGGNQILSGSYVDANGNPVTVTLSTTANNNNSLTLTASPITGSGRFATATYNGTATSTSAFQVSSAAPFASSVSISVLAPTVYRVADSNLNPMPTPPGYMGITSLSTNGENYVFYNTPNDTLDYVNGGSNNGSGHEIPASQTPNPVATVGFEMQGGVVNDTASSHLFSGGNFSITQFSYVPSSPPPPNPQVQATCAPSASCKTTGGIAYDSSSGNYFYGTGSNIVYWPVGGSATAVQTPPPSGFPAGVAWGGFTFDATNARVWAADTESGGFVYMVDANTFALTQSGSLAGAPFDVTTDLLSHAWVTLPAVKQVVEFATPLTNGNLPTNTYTFSNSPQFITADSSQVWFTEANAGGLVLGHINPTTGASAEFPLSSNAGGVAGPIMVLPYANVLAIVHYGGGTSNGEVLLVIP